MMIMMRIMGPPIQYPGVAIINMFWIKKISLENWAKKINQMGFIKGHLKRIWNYEMLIITPGLHPIWLNFFAQFSKLIFLIQNILMIDTPGYWMGGPILHIMIIITFMVVKMDLSESHSQKPKLTELDVCKCRSFTDAFHLISWTLWIFLMDIMT